MAITQNDVRLYASERMTDFADGGGAMSPTVIVDGLDNNVFPDVTDIDRLSGRVNVRKVYAAVVSNDTDTYVSAHALLEDGADDANVDALLFVTPSYAPERAAAIAQIDFAIARRSINSLGSFDSLSSITTTAGSATVTVPSTGSQYPSPSVVAPGELVSVYAGGVSYLREVVSATINTTPGSTSTIVLSAPLPVNSTTARLVAPNLSSSASVFGVALSAAGASSGATSITVGSPLARVVPCDLAAAYPTATLSQWAFAAANYLDTHGQVQFIRAGNPLLIHSTIGMTPATVSNGQTVTSGRTSLSRLRVIGNNGVEHARFTLGVPAPTGVGCTADLTAGTVTFSDVSGMSQPVTVEHRIEEMALASAVAVSTGAITLNRALSRAYPANTKVSSLCMLGDLQARVIGGFAQSAWTGVFSDTVLGGSPTADFNDAVYPIVTTNQGAISDRWTLIFTNTNTFRCIGEATGEITGGSTSLAFAPTNPSTGAPYFTIPAAGWGTGWSAGNVYRFNTSGAQAPLWVVRTISPSAPSSASDSVTVEFRGYVNT